MRVLCRQLPRSAMAMAVSNMKAMYKMLNAKRPSPLITYNHAMILYLLGFRTRIRNTTRIVSLFVPTVK